MKRRSSTKSSEKGIVRQGPLVKEPVGSSSTTQHRLRGRTERTDESIIDLLNLHSRDYDWECAEEFLEESADNVGPELSRTSMLLQDYREFRAARTIQAALRGWFVRHMNAKRERSAAIIQRAWRGFYACRRYFRILEETLQKRIEQHYYRAAQIIQALWRGFWVRENVHDQYRLTRMQIRAAEDLLHCVAFKLHHLLRTHHIPGVYSLRNSNCLSKVEQLLAAMSFKQHNDRVRVARARRENQIWEAKKGHVDSTFQTEVPYAGPNFMGICEPKCCQLFKEADADKKMFKILSLFEKSKRIDPRLKQIRSNPKSRKSSLKGKRTKRKTHTDFCSDVVSSMKRWNILSANNLSIDPHVFKNPENVERFLTEVQTISSHLQPRCQCKVNPRQLDVCK